MLITPDKDAALAYARRLAKNNTLYAREADELGKGDDEPICIRVYEILENRPHITDCVESFDIQAEDELIPGGDCYPQEASEAAQCKGGPAPCLTVPLHHHAKGSFMLATIAPLGQDTLATLAEQINTEHDAARRAAVTALEPARRCGEWLIQAKAQIGHGGFLAWLADNCGVGARQASNYMRVAGHWDRIRPKGHRSRFAIQH